MKRRWEGAGGDAFFPPGMGSVSLRQKRVPVPREGVGREEVHIRAECHPPVAPGHEKHFVSSGFKGTAITSETQDDRTTLHGDGRTKNIFKKRWGGKATPSKT